MLLGSFTSSSAVQFEGERKKQLGRPVSRVVGCYAHNLRSVELSAASCCVLQHSAPPYLRRLLTYRV